MESLFESKSLRFVIKVLFKILFFWKLNIF
jgi:hypothetical protein